MPIALENIGWKTYMINASWDVLEVAFVVFFWVETRKRSLEEIDEIFEGKVHILNQNIIEGHDIEGVKTGIIDIATLSRSEVVLTKVNNKGMVEKS